MRRAAIGIAIAAWFLYCTWFGLSTRLGNDDVMNTLFAWEPPLRELLAAILNPFSTFYRPVGAAAYRTMFFFYGLDPAPFRVFVYTLLLLNIFLVYRLGTKLSGSEATGALAALLFAWHGRMWGIYLNNGTLYDVLCASFSLAALLFYVSIRERGGTLKKWQWAAFIGLFILAINAKEMAATLPAILICYELIRHRCWQFRQWWPLVLCILISLGAAKAKTAEGSVMHGNAPYMMTLTLKQFFRHWNRLMGDLLYRPGSLWTPWTVALWAALLAAAAYARKRHVWVCLAFAFLAPLPVIFLPYRGFFVMYLPMAGWAMLIASLIPARVPVFIVAALALWWIPAHDAALAKERAHPDPSQKVIAQTIDDLYDLDEPVPPGGSMLFLHDRFAADSWSTRMITEMVYRDPKLEVDRPTMMSTPPDPNAYDRVFDYVNGKLTVVSRKLAGGNRPR